VKLVAIVLGLAIVGCGGGGAATEATTRAARHPRPLGICGPLRAAVTGTVQTDEASELSGLAASRSRPRVLWTHNDSGDRPRVFALRPDGSLLADLGVPGAEAVDWEDIAIRGRELYRHRRQRAQPVEHRRLPRAGAAGSRKRDDRAGDQAAAPVPGRPA
jgi:hypothetical protein